MQNSLARILSVMLAKLWFLNIGFSILLSRQIRLKDHCFTSRQLNSKTKYFQNAEDCQLRSSCQCHTTLIDQLPEEYAKLRPEQSAASVCQLKLRPNMRVC